MTMDPLIQTVEVEHSYNMEGKCNYCDGKIYWNPGVIHRRTKKKLPLNEPYNPFTGVSPKRHSACVYNADNFFKKVVFNEDDSTFTRAKKIIFQDKIVGRNKSGMSYVERHIKYRSQQEIDNYNEFAKHMCDYTFDSSVKSGVDYAKLINSIKPRRR